MSSLSQPKPVSALHEILNWSSDRPVWQQDALRRIVTQDVLDDGDFNELDRLCRAKHKADASTDPPIAPRPLAANHLPPAPGATSFVSLVSIANLQRVNRLPSDQALTFGPTPGLTVIYGDNGSGKSGYARVMKKACRTRGVSPSIKPNAFVPNPMSPATADIAFRVAVADQSVSWSDGAPPDPLLANVFVFDGSTAGNYLQEDGPATFTPHGLDILQKLSTTCDTIGARIQREIDTVTNEKALVAKNWNCMPTTKVGILINSLAATTKPSEIEALAGLDQPQTQRLIELNDALKSDPKQKAKETRASASRLRTFASKIALILNELSDSQVATLNQLLEQAKTATTAANLFASGQFDSSYLPGTGSDLWRTLFAAARSFAVTEAYKDQTFPSTFDEAKCVLCQQTLSEQELARFKVFDSFCKNQSQQIATDATAKLRSVVQKIIVLEPLSPELKKIEADLATASLDQKTSIERFVERADARLKTVKDNASAPNWVDVNSLLASPEGVVTTLAEALEKRALMEESADDPTTRAKLLSDRDDLADREWLAGKKDDVLEQIDRHKRISVLEKSKKDTATRAITQKNLELTKQIVTDAFCKRFEIEAQMLGLRTISVKLEEIKGRKGETKFGLRVEGAIDHRIHEIASEGEQRCIALAAFLAELSQASHQSSLVFDDPVSSLDHWHREKIAARLGQEAKTRQVIVFTHDAVFLNDLQTHSHDHSVDVAFRHIEWAGSNPGRCNDGLPWDCKSPEDRIDKLEKEHRQITSNWQPQPSQENVGDMRASYSSLRATVERIVERVVFADVVFRFRSFVKLKDLKYVVGFSDVECNEVMRIHKRCCDVTEAHDPASGKQAPIPEPADLATDIAATKALLAAVRQRRNPASAAGSSSGSTTGKK